MITKLGTWYWKWVSQVYVRSLTTICATKQLQTPMKIIFTHFTCNISSETSKQPSHTWAYTPPWKSSNVDFHAWHNFLHVIGPYFKTSNAANFPFFTNLLWGGHANFQQPSSENEDNFWIDHQTPSTKAIQMQFFWVLKTFHKLLKLRHH